MTGTKPADNGMGEEQRSALFRLLQACESIRLSKPGDEDWNEMVSAEHTVAGMVNVTVGDDGTYRFPL